MFVILKLTQETVDIVSVHLLPLTAYSVGYDSHRIFQTSNQPSEALKFTLSKVAAKFVTTYKTLPLL